MVLSTPLNQQIIHPSWQPLVNKALSKVDKQYLDFLEKNPNDWLPGAQQVFNAFQLPLTQTQFILFGESPYPRQASANGFAFWDGAVSELWSNKGLTKPINRATSLRNFLKMILLAEDQLSKDNLSQDAIAAVDKSKYVGDIDGLFGNLLQQGFLLLNASLVLSEKAVKKDANAWLPFMVQLLKEIHLQNKDVTLVLFGKIAKVIQTLPVAQQFQQFCAEHPYNISFITNPDVLNFFRPLQLLNKNKG